MSLILFYHFLIYNNKITFFSQELFALYAAKNCSRSNYSIYNCKTANCIISSCMAAKEKELRRFVDPATRSSPTNRRSSSATAASANATIMDISPDFDFLNTCSNLLTCSNVLRFKIILFVIILLLLAQLVFLVLIFIFLHQLISKIVTLVMSNFFPFSLGTK